MRLHPQDIGLLSQGTSFEGRGHAGMLVSRSWRKYRQLPFFPGLEEVRELQSAHASYLLDDSTKEPELPAVMNPAQFHVHKNIDSHMPLD